MKNPRLFLASLFLTTVTFVGGALPRAPPPLKRRAKLSLSQSAAYPSPPNSTALTPSRSTRYRPFAVTSPAASPCV